MAVDKNFVIAGIAVFVVLASFFASNTGAYTYVTPCIDGDHDGWGALQRISCIHPEGADCNDNNPDTNPGQLDVCNGIDDNCNGLVDEDFDCSLPAAQKTPMAKPFVYGKD
ncbi:MAG: putative metal-binding motif-containing protein [DPANN group archaeon]|nr:putative metal-binding motif-containing protein [DPANN group archaeon]